MPNPHPTVSALPITHPASNTLNAPNPTPRRVRAVPSAGPDLNALRSRMHLTFRA
jgi:hypothetical protein